MPAMLRRQTLDPMTTTEHTTARANGAYVDVRGVPTYCEITGNGDPLFLLHGGMCTAESFDAQVADLARSYRVYVPEQFGHGRTPDVDGPLTYEAMAQHTIALFEALGVASAHIAGWSDGALVGLLVALRRPKLVRKLVLIDQYVELGKAPEFVVPMFEGWTADDVPPFLREAYAAVSPDGPEHFAVVFEKLRQMWLAPTGIEVGDLAHVVSPTLVLAGETGSFTFAHLGEVFAALPDAQVAVVPGTSHALLWEKPHIANQLIADFLADEQVPKFF
jgi:pimeloyl-ACP methyl ester carboxylesterase